MGDVADDLVQDGLDAIANGEDEVDTVDVEVARVCRLTSAAVGVRLPGEKPGEDLHWIPLSLVEGSSKDLREGATDLTIEVASWFVEKEDF